MGQDVEVRELQHTGRRPTSSARIRVQRHGYKGSGLVGDTYLSDMSRCTSSRRACVGRRTWDATGTCCFDITTSNKRGSTSSWKAISNDGVTSFIANILLVFMDTVSVMSQSLFEQNSTDWWVPGWQIPPGLRVTRVIASGLSTWSHLCGAVRQTGERVYASNTAVIAPQPTEMNSMRLVNAIIRRRSSSDRTQAMAV